MDDENDGKQGLAEAHTPSLPENPGGENAAGADPRAALSSSIEQIADMLAGSDDDQADLLSGSLDLGDTNVLSQIAEHSTATRRGRGRPKGSSNLRNTKVFDYLEQLGHQDPLITLSMIQTADTKLLATTLGIKNEDALKIQVSAAKELLPYKYSKRPQAIDVRKDTTHIFVGANLDTLLSAHADDKALPIFSVDHVIDNEENQ